jgi:5'-3' exonuclease
MGVPGLQSWLKRRYPGAFVPLPADFCCDHLYLDISSTLHQVIRKCRLVVHVSDSLNFVDGGT